MKTTTHQFYLNIGSTDEEGNFNGNLNEVNGLTFATISDAHHVAMMCLESYYQIKQLTGNCFSYDNKVVFESPEIGEHAQRQQQKQKLFVAKRVSQTNKVNELPMRHRLGVVADIEVYLTRSKAEFRESYSSSIQGGRWQLAWTLPKNVKNYDVSIGAFVNQDGALQRKELLRKINWAIKEPLIPSQETALIALIKEAQKILKEKNEAIYEMVR